MIAVQYILDRARAAVADQIEEFKAVAEMRCALSGLPLLRSQAHADHVIHFATLVYRFLESERLHPMTAAKTWDAIESRWEDFHFQNAELRVLYKQANLQRANPRIDWHALNDVAAEPVRSVFICRSKTLAAAFFGAGYLAVLPGVDVRHYNDIRDVTDLDLSEDPASIKRWFSKAPPEITHHDEIRVGLCKFSTCPSVGDFGLVLDRTAGVRAVVVKTVGDSEVVTTEVSGIPHDQARWCVSLLDPTDMAEIGKMWAENPL